MNRREHKSSHDLAPHPLSDSLKIFRRALSTICRARSGECSNAESADLCENRRSGWNAGVLDGSTQRNSRADPRRRIGTRRPARVAKNFATHRPDEHHRARSRRPRRRSLGRLLVARQGRRRLRQRYRHHCLLPDAGAFPSQEQIPRRQRFLWRAQHRCPQARPAHLRAHEPRPQLGRRVAGASRVVHARRAGQRPPHRRHAGALSDLHVHAVHDRLHDRHHARDQRALRRRRLLHERLAHVQPARLLLQHLPQTASAQNARVLG